MHRRSLGSDGADRLGGLELFADTTVGERRMLARLVDEIVCEQGETIMQEGSSEYEFIVLEQGTAEVTRQGRPINQLGSGRLLRRARSARRTARPRTASVTATSPFRGLVFTAHFMREARERFPAIGERIDAAAKEHLQADAAPRRRARLARGRVCSGRRVGGPLRRRLRLLHVGGLGAAGLGPRWTAAPLRDPEPGRREAAGGPRPRDPACILASGLARRRA